MGVLCGGSRRSGASTSLERKSTSTIAARSLSATERVSVVEHPSTSIRTHAARHRCQHAATTRTGASCAATHSSHVCSSANKGGRRGSLELHANVSDAPSTQGKPISHAEALMATTPDETTSTSQLLARRRCAQHSRDTTRSHDVSAEKKGHRWHCSKQSRKTAEEDVVTPPDHPLKSMESSQVLSHPEPEAPPAPMNHVRGRRSTRQPQDTDTVAAAVSGEAILAFAAPAEKNGDAHTQRSVAMPSIQPPVLLTSPPPPPPFPMPSSVSPSPATSLGTSSLSHSNPFFAEISASHQFSDPSVNHHPNASAEVPGSNHRSFDCDNGYGMFFIDTMDSGRGTGSEGESTTSPVTAAAQQQSSSSLPTIPKTLQLLTRRSRRESFVSFGGEVRLT